MYNMGFILYTTDSKLSKEDEEKMAKRVAQSKGIGNFRSLYMNVPAGKEKGIQLIPVGDIATKDEFKRIKDITAQDILVSHRFPPGKGGIVPTNTAVFGDPEKVGREYLRDVIIPICEIMSDEINSDTEIVNRKDLRVEFDLTVV
ncbi:phage portal family protein [Candidatus Enterovibrio escicola]|uniref:hypothetical protein n=2 Tax=Candidatus Enterovibrio escicola TaxID=1927127 RepID=UPI001681143B|nr:hypothetical protein [Candidatus Enterovibrio escacola]